jgi:hypothetical protein
MRGTATDRQMYLLLQLVKINLKNRSVKMLT